MELKDSKQGEVCVLEIGGKLDTNSASELDTKIKSLVSNGERKIVADCTELKYISSSGLRVFIVAIKQLKKEGGSIVIAAMQPHIDKVFEISGFKTIFEVFETTEEAVKSFS